MILSSNGASKSFTKAIGSFSGMISASGCSIASSIAKSCSAIIKTIYSFLQKNFFSNIIFVRRLYSQSGLPNTLSPPSPII